MAMSLIGLTNGTLFGVFSLGFFVPKANAKVKKKFIKPNTGCPKKECIFKKKKTKTCIKKKC